MGKIDKTLRPEKWDAFIGQDKVKDRLQTQIQAAKHRDEPLGHVLLTGAPGCGKTSLSALIAEEMGDEFKSIMVTPSIKM